MYLYSLFADTDREAIKDFCKSITKAEEEARKTSDKPHVFIYQHFSICCYEIVKSMFDEDIVPVLITKREKDQGQLVSLFVFPSKNEAQKHFDRIDRIREFKERANNNG